MGSTVAAGAADAVTGTGVAAGVAAAITTGVGAVVAAGVAGSAAGVGFISAAFAVFVTGSAANKDAAISAPNIIVNVALFIFPPVSNIRSQISDIRYKTALVFISDITYPISYMFLFASYKYLWYA
jgi:hypothetical protein